MGMIDTIDDAGNASSLGALLLDNNLPWVKQFISSLPTVFIRMKEKEKAPYFVFDKNTAYHKFGKIYNRVDIRKIGSNIPECLSKIAYIAQLLTLKSHIDEYKKEISQNGFSGISTTKFSMEITSLVTGTADIVVKKLPQFSRLGYVVADSGAVASTATLTTLSVIGQGIGAFLLGWELGKLIGKIPCGNGHNVQYYIDARIDEIWEHPYQTLGIIPSGLCIATLIAAWKGYIDWNVNRVSNLPPITPQQQREIEKYKMQHKELYIQSTPPRLYMTAR